MIIKEYKELFKIKELGEQDLVSLSSDDKETLLKSTYSSLERINVIKNKSLCEFFIGLTILIIGIIKICKYSFCCIY